VIVVALVHVSTKTSSCLPTFMFHDEILGLLQVGIWLYFASNV